MKALLGRTSLEIVFDRALLAGGNIIRHGKLICRSNVSFSFVPLEADIIYISQMEIHICPEEIVVSNQTIPKADIFEVF